VGLGLSSSVGLGLSSSVGLGLSSSVGLGLSSNVRLGISSSVGLGLSSCDLTHSSNFTYIICHYLFQIGASMLDGNDFVMHLLNKYGLMAWIK